MSAQQAELRALFQTKDARVAVIGAGYVGLPLAVEVASSGLRTLAYDRSVSKVEAINAGHSYIADVSSESVKRLVTAGQLRATAEPDDIAEADAIIVCVPTPLNKTKDPDNSFVLSAADMIAQRLRPGHLIILESTTFPGFTREVLAPRLEEGARAAGHPLVAGQDFHLAFSPERVDPGNATFQTKNTPKVMGASSAEGLELALGLYAHFIDTLVPVSDTDTAEMVKLLENTFRAVNIGLVNEVAIMCQHLGLDTWEVIEAAATKPFGFMPFYPGPGLGGHCIPIDPLYLSWKLKTLKYQARFISLADEINSSMPEFVVAKVSEALNSHAKPINGSRILICGVAYKKDIDDVRESPALDIIALLTQRGAKVAYADPHVTSVTTQGSNGPVAIERVGTECAADFDCVVIATNHTAVDHEKLVEDSQLVVDTRNATRRLRKAHADKIVSL